MEGLKHYFLSDLLTWETLFIQNYTNVSDLCKAFTNDDCSVLRSDGGGGTPTRTDNQLLLKVLPFKEAANIMAGEVFANKMNQLCDILVGAARLYKTNFQGTAVAVINQVTEHGSEKHPFAEGVAEEKIKMFLEFTNTRDRNIAKESLAKYNNDVTAAVDAFHDGKPATDLSSSPRPSSASSNEEESLDQTSKEADKDCQRSVEAGNESTTSKIHSHELFVDCGS